MGAARPAPFPSLPGAGGRRDKTPSRWQPAPEWSQTKRKPTGPEPGARCRVCARPAARPDRMMDGPAGARPSGRPAIYITLPVHRSPLTPHCLGQRPTGPRRPSHPAPEAWKGPAWRGQRSPSPGSGCYRREVGATVSSIPPALARSRTSGRAGSGPGTLCRPPPSVPPQPHSQRRELLLGRWTGPQWASNAVPEGTGPAQPSGHQRGPRTNLVVDPTGSVHTGGGGVTSSWGRESPLLVSRGAQASLHWTPGAAPGVSRDGEWVDLATSVLVQTRV